MPTKLNRDDIERKVRQAVISLLNSDLPLLKTDANERTVTQRLAFWLQAEFREWTVDCEYNRDGDITKRISQALDQAPPDNRQHRIVIPDIIIHHRGRGSEGNLVVFEVKKSTNGDSGDSDKANLLDLKNQYGYKCTVFLRLKAGSEDITVENAIEEIEFG